MRTRFAWLWMFLLLPALASADEPNETFFEATILPPGELSVSDELSGGGSFPDTVVGARGFFGDIVAFDDQGSPYGDGNASALYGVPTNSGSIDFAITGWPDTGFFGDHGETGGFEAYVTVYNFFGEEVDMITINDTLTPGLTFEYSNSDPDWISGSYDVEIDNTLGVVGDIDFYTFTGLVPGAGFSAETFDPEGFGVDTVLGWFDEFGDLIEYNDDFEDGSLLSQITGDVPSNGELTFAVSGYPDSDFVGDHGESAPYDLVVTLDVEGIPGDFNGDFVVNAADYTVWRDADGPEVDYLTWAANYGAVGAIGTGAATPEPAGLLLALATLAATAKRR